MSDYLILIVEDDPTLQLLARMAIGKLGCRCEVVGTGEEAVERAHEGVSLIFMDIGLPGITGTDAAVLIRERI